MPRGRPPRHKSAQEVGESKKLVKSDGTSSKKRTDKKQRASLKESQSRELPVGGNESASEEEVDDKKDRTMGTRKRGRPRKPDLEVEDSSLKQNYDDKNVSAKPVISCEICGKRFKFRATLKQHEQIHYGIKEFECEQCHRRFMHKGTLKVHMRLHTGELPYQCPHCPKRFRGQTALDCHVFRHTKQGTKCPQCDSLFATPSIVKQHIREVHTTERSHTCQICGVTYKHRKTLRLHLRNHQKRICPDCGRVFHSVYAMMTHRKIHAQDHFQFRCGFCDRKFEKEDELQSHGKLRGRTFQCEMCCHSFNKADYLENHNRRNHWKEMGLEQLKVAAPKNGWNRKGVPKPKKAVKDSEPVEETELVGWDGGPVQETIIQTIEVTEPPEIIQQYEVIHYEGLPAEAQIVVKTITTEIERVLPQDTVQGELERNEVEDYEEVESIGDYNDHDYSLAGEFAEGEAVEELNCETIEAKNEPESLEQLDCDTKQFNETSYDELASKPVAMKQEARESSSSDSEDEPLAKLVTSKTTEDIPLLKEEIKREPLDLKEELDSSSEDQQSSDGESPKPRRKRKANPKDTRQGPKRELQCSFCGECFKGRKALKEHKQALHPDLTGKSGPFVCELCGKKYATASSLVVHRGKHAEYQRFKCDECPKAFTYRCYLDNHKRAEHLHERLICQKCGKLFKYPQDLKVHTKQHEDEKPFKCDICPSSFRFPSALRCHKAMHVATIFSCDICQKQFKYANSLRVHKKLHTGKKRFQCQICDREFNTKAPLVRHLAIHSIEREMKCVACDKIFYKKIDLVIHQTKEHPNHPMIGRTVKIHTCPVCGQEFTKKSNLKSHSYIHGDEFKFACDLCEDQKFKQHAGLRHHLTHFHKLVIRKRKPKEEKEQDAGGLIAVEQPLVDTAVATKATLMPGVSVLHNGVQFMVQQVQCE
uniref:Zinc finger protein 62 homolog n=1 Tax=Culex pipiens TaxID=7175 RepID=A0A8D8E2Q3_CULPI